MIDHIGFRVRDLASARLFYEATMQVLGLSVIDNTPTSFLVGRDPRAPVPFIWIGTEEPAFWLPHHNVSASPLHLALSADSRAAVHRFHRAALANGGKDNGPPGLRGPPERNYYAAFALDPDGNNIEAGFRG